MCLVIDTNCFSLVFNISNLRHAEFKPVLDWIIDGKGKVVYGGSKYLSELKKATRYLKLFAELKRAGKAIEVDRRKVDRRQKEIESFVDPRKHNDPHLPAIACVSGCAIICTQDGRAHKLLKDKRCYRDGVRPKIYGSTANVNLLCDRYIVGICKPALRVNALLRQSFRINGMT